MRVVAEEPPALGSFEGAWERIVAERGEFFRTRGGRYFTYKIDGDFLFPSHSDLHLRKEHFAVAHQLVPIPSPGKLARLIEGPEYVWAILHDERISRGCW